MKVIPIKKGVFSLLILEAAILALATVIFSFRLYSSYTNLVYNESAEVLGLYTIVAQTRLSRIEELSFEILSNHTIQGNMKTYHLSDNSYEKNVAKKDLYTQLFTRWVMDKNILSISFIFTDGDTVETSSRRALTLSVQERKQLISLAAQTYGSLDWAANIAGENTITLYRSIKDISGDGFKPMGTLIINIDVNYLLENASEVQQKYNPDIICVADGQILSNNPTYNSQTELLNFIDSKKAYNIITVNREQYFISIRGLGDKDWYLVYILPAKDILTNLRSTNLLYMMIFLVIVTLVLFIGYQITIGITRPIIRLTRAMKVVEKGDYSIALEEPETIEKYAVAEVMQLSRDFSEMVQKIDHLINEGYVKQLMIMEMRYKVLQQQINPHFLYNTLDTIHWKAVQSNHDEISKMVRALSNMLRGSIKVPDIIPLKEDISFVDDYITIQKMRFEQRLDYQESIPAALWRCNVPRLTLQPIVENCIIHNLEKYSTLCRIRISARVAADHAEIYVTDNGRGADLQHVEKVIRGEAEAGNNSIGLKNIHERIKISFGEQYGIIVENMDPSGTKVTVLLPLTKGVESNENTFDCG
ncbi:MAG: sensor histidine kinase [Ruminiclostridium sp.]|nr:sensor histidine kinase [Ruminiclostridium sp.]